MESNKSKFRCDGYFYNGAELIEIEIGRIGDAARYLSRIRYATHNEIQQGRWQEIRYGRKYGYPYIMKNGRRLYLHNFIIRPKLTSFIQQ